MDINLTQLLKGNFVNFAHYRKGVAYYTITNPAEDNKMYVFPVDLADIGDATLLAKDRAMLFMRYIRQAIADNTFVAFVACQATLAAEQA